MHIFCVGMTLHGKTYLVKQLVKHFLQSKKYRGCLVCDPNCEPKSVWPANYTTDDPKKLLDVSQRNRDCILVHEECGEQMPPNSRIASDCKYFATRCRHQGHISIFVAQRAQDIDRRFRGQCTQGFLFRQSPLDAEYTSKMLGYSEYLMLSELKKYDFMTYQPGKAPVVCRL